MPPQAEKPVEKKDDAGKPEKPGLGKRIGGKLKTGLTAFSLLMAGEMAMDSAAFADKGSHAEKMEASPKERWGGKMHIVAEEEVKAENKTIYYCEGDMPPTPDGRKVRSFGVTITDTGKPKVHGDEKYIDVSIVEEAADKDHEMHVTVKNETAAEAIRDGKMLIGPFGKAKYVEQDGELRLATDKDREIAVLEKHYWAIYGLKQAHKLDAPAGKAAISEVDEWMVWVDGGAFEDAGDKAQIKKTLRQLIEEK